MNPYEVLGIEPTADAAVVKKAYRQRAKLHHPDAGGDPEAFREVAIAYSVLSDQEKRQHFDQTGEIDMKSVNNMMSEVVNGIAAMLEMVVKQTRGKMNRLNLIETLRDSARQSAQNWTAHIQALEDEIRDFEVARKRTKRNDDEKNLFVEIFDTAIQERQANRKAAVHHLNVAKRCLEELMAYESEVDVFRSVQGMMFASASTTSDCYYANVRAET